MAISPYTQDINKTIEANRKRDEPSYTTQAVGLFTKLVEKHQEKAEENITKLGTDFVFEKQALNSRINGYKNVMTLQDEIRKDYGGSNESYARAKVNENFTRDLIAKGRIKEGDAWKVINDSTPLITEKFLATRIKNYTGRLNEMFETASNIDLDAPDSTFVDSVFTNQINQLPDSVRGKGWEILGDLVSGQGFKVGDKYSITRQDILDRVYSDIPNEKLGTLGEQFKNLYTLDSALATQYTEVILPNQKIGTGIKVVSKELEREVGGGKVRYIEMYQTYIDEAGKPQATAPVRTLLNKDEVYISAEARVSNFALYNDKGQSLIKELMENGTDLVSLYEQVNADYSNFKNPSEQALILAYKSPLNQEMLSGLYDTFLVKNKFATVEDSPAGFGKTQVVEIKDNQKMEGYKSFADWKTGFIANATRGGDQITQPFEPILNDSKETVAYSMGSSSFDNSIWQSSKNGTNEVIVNAAGKPIPFTESILSDLGLNNDYIIKLGRDYNNQDYQEITPQGIYYDNIIVNPVQFKQLTGADVNKDVEFGYDINKEEVTWRWADKIVSQETTTDEPKKTTGTWEELMRKTGLNRDVVEQANDIPVIGAITEKLLGPDLDKKDALWLIPFGPGALKKWGSPLIKAGGKYGVGKIISSNSKFIKEIKKHYKKKDLYLGKGSVKAYNEYVKSLGPIEKSILLSFNKLGTKVDEKQLVSNLLKLPYIKLLMKSSGNTVLKYTAPAIPAIAAQWFYGDEEEPKPDEPTSLLAQVPTE